MTRLSSVAADRAQVQADLPCTAKIVQDASELDGLETEWKALFNISPTASPPLRWEWVREWWRIFGPVYGQSGRGLRIITVRRGSALVGVLPLYCRVAFNCWPGSRWIGFISTGAAQFEETCTEYLDLLHAPREAAACRQAIVTALNEADQLRWDELDLRDMSVASPLVGLGAQFTGSRARVRCGPTESCPLSNLVGGFEAYLRRLSQGARGEARKLLREVERSGMKFEIAADAHAAGAFFDQMIVLHRDRWAMAGKSGSFAPRHAQFHRTLAKQLAPHGEVVLARLCLGDEPFAVTYGHRVHATYHCYQRGVSRLTEPVRSPGTALLLLLMARLAEGGVTRYEHLKGSNPFKERFATEHAEVTHLRVTRSNLRSLSTSASDWIARGLRKGLRAMRRR